VALARPALLLVRHQPLLTLRPFDRMSPFRPMRQTQSGAQAIDSAGAGERPSSTAKRGR